ncbi:MAG: hypothetical protein ACXVB6_17020, partial [Mucilaginibacter sp.]
VQLMAAGPSYFCRHKSNQKGCQPKCFFAPVAFTLQIRQNHGLQNLAPLFVPACPCFSKYCYALPTLEPTIVLPDFARSCSADGKH